MRIESITIENHPPISSFSVSSLSDLVVFAGPNGIGKTRLVSLLIDKFRSPGGLPNARMVLAATNPEEKRIWGADTLDLGVQSNAPKLAQIVNKQQRRGRTLSTVLNFDAFRQFQPVQQVAWSWSFADPNEEMMGWDYLFNPLQNRFTDTLHSIYRIVGHHKDQIANRAIELQRSGQTHMDLDFKDPLTPFRDAFGLLLAPKRLVDVDSPVPSCCNTNLMGKS